MLSLIRFAAVGTLANITQAAMPVTQNKRLRLDG